MDHAIDQINNHLMEWYWSYRSLPELAEFSPKERKRIWNQCREETKSKPLMIRARIANALLPMVPLFVILTYVHGFWMYLLSTAIAFGAADLLTAPFIIAAALPRIRQVVRDRCISCGYSLVGNVSGRCPECGAEIKSKSPEL
jgi:hypothetical protein